MKNPELCIAIALILTAMVFALTIIHGFASEYGLVEFRPLLK